MDSLSGPSSSSNTQGSVTKVPEEDGKTAAKVSDSGRKVTTVVPEKKMTQNMPAAKDSSVLEERKVSPASNSGSMPAIQAKSANMIQEKGKNEVSDGTIFIEANGNPEQAAKKTVEEIEKKQGSAVATRAKAFFGAVLDFCKAHKNEILTIAGFALVTAGIAGGVACPVVFVLAAPGLIALGCGMGGLLSEDKALSPPSGNPENSRVEPEKKEEETPTPEGKAENDKKEPAGKKESKSTGTDDDFPVSSQPAPARNDDSGRKKTKDSSEGGTPAPKPSTPPPPPPPLPGKVSGKTDSKQLLSLANSLQKNIERELSRSSSAEQSSGLETDGKLENLRNSLKKTGAQPEEKIRTEDFPLPDIEKALEGISPEMQQKIYTEYSKVVVGFHFFRNSMLQDKSGKAQEAAKVRSDEMDALMHAMEKKALEKAVSAAKEQKVIKAHEMATGALENIRDLTEKISMPSGNDNKEGVRKNQVFREGVNQFFVDFAESLKSSRFVNSANRRKS